MDSFSRDTNSGWGSTWTTTNITTNTTNTTAPLVWPKSEEWPGDGEIDFPDPWPFGTILGPSQKRLREINDPKSIADHRLMVIVDGGGAHFVGLPISGVNWRDGMASDKWLRESWEPVE